MNVVLVAEESAGLQMLRALARSEHRLVAVLAAPPKPGSVGVNLWKVATDSGFETWPAELVRSAALADRFRAQDVDILLNIHSLYVIHPEVLGAPKIGSFNLHPGPLPRYAGLNAVSWAIFRGEQSHGVTVHRMEPDIDAGPIVYQTSFPIDADDTALSLSFKCVREGIILMLRLLEVASVAPADIPLTLQDSAMREYFGSEVPGQGRICWSWPACKVVNLVRACDYLPFRSPWGHALARLGVQEFALLKASRTGFQCDALPGKIGKSTDSGVYVACQDEWVLASKLHVAGRYLPAQEVLRPGDQLADLASS
jgi:methionyl-tRNA formyltransferase